MNRLVLIGNGFDLAHGLKTSYKDFINWYWENWGVRLLRGMNRIESDGLCTFEINSGIDISNWAYVFGWYYQRKNPLVPWDPKKVVERVKEDSKLCNFSMSPFLERINKSIETKGWVDIENDYYELLKKFALEENDETKVKDLNEQLHLIQDKLIEFLTLASNKEVKPHDDIKSAIYSEISERDVAIEGKPALQKHIDEGMLLSDEDWKTKLNQYYDDDISEVLDEIKEIKKANQRFLRNQEKNESKHKEIPKLKRDKTIGFDYIFSPTDFFLPNEILLLNFNYTKTAELYCPKQYLISINHIHGILDNPKSVIFGYGDEMDEKYKEIVKKNDNQYLGNIKSIKYLEADNYRKVLDFIEYAPYQIFIMGHSCGNSDRTLLNTLFEHRNCVSIKPYYYKKEDGTDNYLELVQNISRNFTDMKLMRDRVVNKEYCEPLTK